MLTLDYKSIANWQNICLLTDLVDPRKKVENPFNFTMGMFLMHTGIQRLTHKNATTFYMRAKLIEVCFGSLHTNGDGTPRYIEAQDVINYIGLSSNVSSYTDAQFFAHLRNDVVRNLKQTMDYYLREHDKQIKQRVLATVEADPELRKLSGE